MHTFWKLLECTLREFRKLIWKVKKKASFNNAKHAEWEGDVFYAISLKSFHLVSAVVHGVEGTYAMFC